MATAPSLLSLPIEILVLIAANLEASDYGALRLSCRALDDCLFPCFAQAFFASKCFFRNGYSFSVLHDISESRLSPYVKTVVLSTELLPSHLYPCAGRAPVDNCLATSNHERALCASGWDRSLLSMAASRLDRTLLSRSFARLPNLEGLIVREFEGACLQAGDLGNNPSWNQQTKGGYGLSTIMEEFGFGAMDLFRQDKIYGEEVGISCVQAMLAAAVLAEKPLKTFEIIYQKAGRRAVTCDALQIPWLHKREMPRILSTIQDLHLDVFQKRLTPWPLMTGADQIFDTVQCDTFPLRNFLGLTGQLRRLTLRQLNHNEQKDAFWDWMAAVPSEIVQYKGPGDAERLITPPPVAFDYLRELRLELLSVPIKPLSNMVRKVSRTLRKLSFRSILLYSMPAEPDHGDLPRNLWKELFRVLLEDCGDLDEIEIRTSFSKRLSDSYAGNGGDNLPQTRHLLICQHSIHYKGTEETKMKLNNELQTSRPEEPPLHLKWEGQDPLALYVSSPDLQIEAQLGGDPFRKFLEMQSVYATEGMLVYSTVRPSPN